MRVRVFRWGAVAAMVLCAALIAAPQAARAPQDQDAAVAVRLARAWERLDAFIAREMDRQRTPGLALALTTREGTVRVATYGFADLKTRQPVTPDTLFEIGSISKSFTAIALLQLREEGKFDPHRPVSDYLPWFSVRTRFAPITGHHLLTHTAGIPRDRDDIPTSLYQAVALRERETGSPPGARSSYSNIGFQVLGSLLEELTGQSYGAVIRRRILAPLGMSASEPVITFATRERLAVGYQHEYDDRPAHRSHALVEAQFFEYGAGDGSIAATPANLAAYLRMLLNRGAYPGGRLLSEESFGLMTQRTVRAHEDQYSGYGIAIGEKEGRTILWHGGGMVGYSSMLRGEMETGIGAVVFVNGPGNPGRVAEFALDCLRAALHQQALPELPPVESPARIANAADYAGTFTSPDERKLVFAAEGQRLYVIHHGERVPLERRGRDAFLAAHPDFALFPLRFARQGGTGKQPGVVAEVSHGADWFFQERYTGPRKFDVPAEWEAYPGHYRTNSPWLSNFRVLVRKGKLWLVFPSGGEEELAPLEAGRFRVGAEEQSAERLRFDAVIGGRAARANLSGVDFYRTFTP